MLLIKERPAKPGQTTQTVNDALERSVRALAIPRHRVANARGNALVRTLVADELAAAGFEVSVEGTFGNVVALPKGGHVKRLVTAHYDAVPDCPGADDNASGVAVLLACARRASGAGRLGFVAFNAEEDGMLGSVDFVARWRARLASELEVAHVLEMVGSSRGCAQRSPLPWPTRHFAHADFLGLLGKGRGNQSVTRLLHAGVDEAPRVLGARVFGPVDRLLPDLRMSDHIAFWDEGLPAVMWTDTAYFRTPHYHRPSDRPETLDYSFMTRVLELLVSEAAADEGGTSRRVGASKLHGPCHQTRPSRVDAVEPEPVTEEPHE